MENINNRVNNKTDNLVSTASEIKIFENIDNTIVWSKETIETKESVLYIYQVQLKNLIQYRGKSYHKSEVLYKELLKKHNKEKYNFLN